MKTTANGLIEKNNFEGKLPDEYFRFLEQRILPEYRNHNTLAMRYQTNFKFWGSVVFIAAFLSLFIIGLGISFFEQIPKSFFLIELIFLLFILVAYLVTNHSGHHSKWIDYRLKAEQLRINSFSILTTKPQIFFKQRDGDKQILERIIVELGKSSIEDVKDYLIKNWLEDQRSFHDHKLKNYQKKEILIKMSIRIIFILAIVVSILHLVLDSHLYENILILSALGLPALGAALVGIKSHRDYSTISFNSKRMVDLITDFVNKLKGDETYDELFKTVKKIEWLFINELERWETIIRNRELELAI